MVEIYRQPKGHGSRIRTLVEPIIYPMSVTSLDIALLSKILTIAHAYISINIYIYIYIYTDMWSLARVGTRWSLAKGGTIWPLGFLRKA